MSLDACRVERLRMFRFRNYSDETIELGRGLNLITGANAQGKTNLLEAVATLALSRSPRAPSTDLLQWGAPECRIQATLMLPSGRSEVDVHFRRAEHAGAAIRTSSVDGHPRAARAMLGLCPVVLFWPEDLLLVKGGPDNRRRLLDTVLAQLDQRAAVELLRYRRTLEQRNALLRQHRQGAGDLRTLGGFDLALARHGGWVRAARARLVAALGPLAADGLAELSGGREVLQLTYQIGGTTPAPGDAPDEWLDDCGTPAPAGATADQPRAPEPLSPAALQAEAAGRALADELGRRRGEELARGITLVGPHRDDLGITLDGHPARSAASQGQQRSIVLACKLAEVRHVVAETAAAPVLVLDDVLSELDPARRTRLLQLLGAGERSQALITTTEPTALDGASGEVRRFTVRAGHVDAGTPTMLAMEAG